MNLRSADGSVRWVASVPLSWSGPILLFGGDAIAGSALPAGSPGALSAFRLSDGAPTSTATVPTQVHVPLSVAGSDLLVQPTDPSYACAATGPVSAVGHAS